MINHADCSDCSGCDDYRYSAGSPGNAPYGVDPSTGRRMSAVCRHVNHVAHRPPVMGRMMDAAAIAGVRVSSIWVPRVRGCNRLCTQSLHRYTVIQIGFSGFLKLILVSHFEIPIVPIVPIVPIPGFPILPNPHNRNPAQPVQPVQPQLDTWDLHTPG